MKLLASFRRKNLASSPTVFIQPHRSGWPGGRNDLCIARAERFISLDMPGKDITSSFGDLAEDKGVIFCCCFDVNGSKSDDVNGTGGCRWFRLSCSKVFQRVNSDRVLFGTLNVSTNLCAASFVDSRGKKNKQNVLLLL